MRVIRSAGQNVSPSDDGRLFDQIFSDGLFTETSITNLGGNNISIGAMYGDLCGRDFTTEAQTLAVVLPEGEGESTGYIYVEIDTSSEDVISVNSALAPFTPTYEDINTNGAVAQMIIAEYTATNLNVTSVTATYSTAGAGGVEPGSIATIERSPATANHSIGEFIVYNSKLYKVIAAIVTGETLVEGTNIESASVGSELTSLNNGLSTLLWTNPNPSASFSPQTIPMDLTNYKFLLIGYRYAKETSVQSAQIIIKGIDSIITSPHMSATGGNYFRYINSSDTAVEIGRGVKGGSGDDSGVNVPTYIYGIK